MRWTAGGGAGLVFILAVLTTMSPTAKALRQGETLTGVVMGTDLAERSPHTDTLLVWFYHPRSMRLDLLSIPRDTLLDLPGYRFHRVNEVFAYHYGQDHNGPDAAREVLTAVGRLFFQAGVPITLKNWVQLDFDGFRRAINAWGGVSVVVAEPMDYDDKAGGFRVHLSSGTQRLNGADALGYVRFRGRSGDRGRIQRQMDFLREVFNDLISPRILWRGPPAFVSVAGAWCSNLRVWELLLLAMESRRVSVQGINTLLLPGQPKGPAWKMDPERTRYLLNQLKSSPSVSPVPGHKAPPEEIIRVNVWNASGRMGLALEVARWLRSKGFDVVEWGNFHEIQPTSRVVDRSGRFDPARSVADCLGVSSLVSDMDASLRTDVDVVVGRDFVFPTDKTGEGRSWK